MEQLEVRKDSYLHGLWGYCGAAGAKDLLSSIEKLTEMAKASPILVCDRAHALNCDESNEKCKCLVDDRNFRNIASKYWTDGDQEDASKLGRSTCVLITGSDCAIEGQEIPCIPGTICKFKDDKKPCTLTHFLTRKQRSSKDSSREKRDVDSQGTGASPNGASPDTDPNDLFVPRKYTFMRTNFPTPYCQCIGYEGKASASRAVRGQLPSLMSVVFLLLCILKTADSTSVTILFFSLTHFSPHE